MKLKKELEVQPDDPTDQTVFRFPHCSRRGTLSVSGIETNISNSNQMTDLLPGMT